jgi:GT2 family glycosyltransferase
MASVRACIPALVREVMSRSRAALLSLDLWLGETPELPEQERAVSGDFSVIVPIHDAPEATERCLSAIRRYGGNAQVILVDDGSRLESTRGLIRQTVEDTSWELIRHDVPTRHSRACEAGGKLATRKYLLFLNSDAIITPWTWLAPSEAFDADPAIAVVGPSTCLNPHQLASPRASRCARHWTNEQIYAFAGKYVRRHRLDPLVDLQEASGSAFFVRRDVWERCDGFHPELPDYGNESELCKRLLRDGGRIVWTRAAYIHHIGACSIRNVISAQEKQRRHEAARKFIDELYPQDEVSCPHPPSP